MFKFFLFLVCAVTVEAAEISGSVTIKDIDGAPLESLSDAVVFIESVPDGTKLPVQHEKYSMSSKGKEFVPSILPISVGSKVTFPNDDVILHNVFSLSKTKPFDLGLYKKGENKTVTFEKSGLVKVYCNIHEKMVGFILVLDNPFYALTNAKGEFKIKDVPPGKYKLVAWHRYSDQDKKEIVISSGKEIGVEKESISVGFALQQEKKSIKHLNKWGKEYKAKY